MSVVRNFINSRSEAITEYHLDLESFRDSLKELGMTKEELSVTNSLNIPAKREIVKEALSQLKGDEITTFGALSKLVGSRGAQGVTSIVLSPLIDPVAASRVFSAPKGGVYVAGDTVGGFASHDHAYQDIVKPRSQALSHTDIQFQQVGESVILNNPRFMDEHALAERLTYLP